MTKEEAIELENLKNENSFVWVHLGITDNELMLAENIHKECTSPKNRILVYAALSSLVDDKTQISGYKLRDISQMTGLSAEVLCRAVYDLGFLGFIKMEKMYNEDGSRSANLYTILPIPNKLSPKEV